MPPSSNSSRGKKASLLARIILLIVRTSKVYLHIRLHLWKWRIKQRKKFKKAIKPLPKELAEDLYKAYLDKIESIRLPGLRELYSTLRGGSPHKVRVSEV